MSSPFSAIAKWTGFTVLRSFAVWLLNRFGIWPYVLSLVGGLVAAVAAFLQDVPIWALIFIVVGAFTLFLFLIIGIAFAWDRFCKYRPTKSNKALIRSWIKLSNEIVTFLADEERREKAFESFPGNRAKLSERRKNEEWARMIQEMHVHSRMLRASYAEKFGVRVDVAKMQLNAKGLLKKENDLWAHDTNPLTMKDAARKIGVCAHQYAEKCGVELNEDR